MNEFIMQFRVNTCYFVNTLRCLLVIFITSMLLTGCTRENKELKMLAVQNGNTIWIMNADGSEPKALTNTGTDGTCNDASWSPDGETIVYKKYINPDYYLCTMDPDGNNKKVLYTTTTDIVDSTFTPDSTRIAFGEGTDCMIYNLNTGNVSVLDTSPVTLGTICFLSFSADGKISILHTSWALYWPGTGWFAGTGTNNWGATYNSDGSYFAYDYGVDTTLRLVSGNSTTLDTAGTSLDTGTTGNGLPAWDPSGEHIYYNKSGIWRVNKDGSGMECIVSDSTFTNPQIQCKSR